MAGLVAAYELLRAGHDPVVLEAQQRVGGRIYTMREPFSAGLYAEVGAMRIPRAHRLTLAYVDKFGLPTADFTMNNPDAWCHLFGRKHRFRDIDAKPHLIGAHLPENERGRTCEAMWQRAIQPFADRVARQGDDAWAEIVDRYDDHSTREFLEERGWSEAAIELFGLLMNQESLMNTSFLELLREEVGRCYVDMVRIDGGMDQLPRAFLPALASRVRFGARLSAVDQNDDGVTIHYQTVAGRGRVTGDHAILAVPFPVLRHVEMLKPLSQNKRRAIRQLHYDASAKILFQCRRRFWEEDDGIFGGGSVTDLAVRNIYYPEQGRETGRGILLASYTWSEDAQRWGSLSPEERIVQALENVARHPPAGPRRVRGRRVEDVARRSVRRRRVRAVRAEPADAALRAHHRAGGPHPLRRRARVAAARVDPGRHRIRTARGGRDQRDGAMTAPGPRATWAHTAGMAVLPPGARAIAGNRRAALAPAVRSSARGPSRTARAVRASASCRPRCAESRAAPARDRAAGTSRQRAR